VKLLIHFDTLQSHIMLASRAPRADILLRQVLYTDAHKTNAPRRGVYYNRVFTSAITFAEFRPVITQCVHERRSN